MERVTLSLSAANLVTVNLMVIVGVVFLSLIMRAVRGRSNA